MCSVNQHLCRRRQMCRKLSQIHPVHSLLFDTKKDLSWVNYLVMARFQLICLFSGDKNKVQMCSVTQHQYRCRQICRKLSPNSPSTLLFVGYKKWLVLAEQSIAGNVQLIKDFLLCSEQTTDVFSQSTSV